MKTVVSILALITLFNSPADISVENGQLLGRWVVNDPSNPGSFLELDEINLKSYESQEAQRLPMHLKYGGITFQKDGVLIEHWWNKCGTGNPPSSAEGEWKISDGSNEMIVTISGTSKWNGSYLIQFIDSETLNLKRKN